MPILSSIEVLEARIAPANVTATYAGGKLTVVGDGDANSVYLGALSDGFSVGTGAGSHLIFNGTDLGDAATQNIHGPVTTVAVDLGAGDDYFESFFTSFGKDVTIKGGAGKDTIKTVGLHVGGKLSIDSGADDDTLMLEADLEAGKLAIDMGAGTNKLQFNNTHLDVEGDSTIKAGTGVDTITTSQQASFTFGKKLEIALGGGDDSIGFGQDALNQPDLFEVGGKFTITQAAHTGTFKVNLNPQILRLGGDFSITTDGKTGGTNVVNFGGGFVTAAGKTTFKSTGNAVDTYTFNAVSVQLLGAVSADLGDGNNTMSVNSVFATTTLGALSYKGGAGDDKITFVGGSPVVITGATDVKLGDGTNEFSEVYTNNTFQTLTFGGGLAVTGGKGVDTVSFDVYDATIGGKGVKLTLGDGGDIAKLKTRNSLGIYGSFTSTSGAGNTTVTVESGYLQVRGGMNATFGAGQGNLTINGGRVELGSLKYTATGAGDDALNIAAAYLGVKSGFTAKGDAGALNISATINNAFDLGSVSITTKAGGGTTNFLGGGNINGKFSYTGGTGANNLYLGRDGGYQILNLHDTLNVTSKATTGNETLQLHHVLALGAVSAKLGAAANTVAFDDITFLGAVTVDTGAGADFINVRTDTNASVAGNVFFYGAVKLLTGAGNDVVNLGSASGSANFFVPVASTLIDGGADSDTVNNIQVYDGMNFFSPTEKNFETTTP